MSPDAFDLRAALDTAEALYREGKLAESEQAFSELLRTDGRAAALYGLGRISYRADNLGRAQALFEQSLGVERRSANALYYLGRTLTDRGSERKAIAYLQEALTYQPDHQPTLRLLASLQGESAAQLSHPVGPAASSRAMADPGGARSEPSPPPASPTAGPPWPPNDPQALVGIVSHLSKGVAPWRGKPAAAQLWGFRVELQDASPGGGPARMLGVEMRGHEITGNLENGDWVEISERPKAGKPFRPKKLRNLSTNDQVRVVWNVFMS